MAREVVCTDEFCSRQELQHPLHLLVPGGPRLRTRYSGIVGIPAQLLGHELHGSLQDVLAVVDEVLGLVGEGEGVQRL